MLVFNSEMNEPTLEPIGWYIAIYKALSLGHFFKKQGYLDPGWSLIRFARDKKNAARELNWNIWRCLWSNTRSISTLGVYTWPSFMFSKSLVYVSQDHLSTLEQLFWGDDFSLLCSLSFWSFALVCFQSFLLRKKHCSTAWI